MSKKWIVNILDKSGSMEYLVPDVLKNYNVFLKDIKETLSENVFILDGIEYVDIRWTTITFNKEIEELNDDSVKNINEINTYVAEYSTSLLDAIGYVCIKCLKNTVSYDDIIVNIFTDGVENSSKFYTYKSINELLSVLKLKEKIDINFYCTTKECLSFRNHVTEIDTNRFFTGSLKECVREMSQRSRSQSYVPPSYLQTHNSCNISEESSSKRQKLT